MCHASEQFLLHTPFCPFLINKICVRECHINFLAQDIWRLVDNLRGEVLSSAASMNLRYVQHY